MVRRMVVLVTVDDMVPVPVLFPYCDLGLHRGSHVPYTFRAVPSFPLFSCFRSSCRWTIRNLRRESHDCRQNLAGLAGLWGILIDGSTVRFMVVGSMRSVRTSPNRSTWPTCIAPPIRPDHLPFLFPFWHSSTSCTYTVQATGMMLHDGVGILALPCPMMHERPREREASKIAYVLVLP